MPGNILPDRSMPDYDYAAIFAALPEDIQDEILDETQQVHDYCARQGFFSTMYDCECIGARFFEHRLAEGTETAPLQVVNRLARQCPNEPAMAAYGYSRCINQSVYFQHIADEVCQCAGNEFAQRFARSPSSSFSYLTNLTVSTTSACHSRLLRGGR